MTEDEVVGWHHLLNGHELEQTLGDGGGHRSLVCFNPWGHKESDHQKLQPPPQVLSSSLLQENHFKSMNSRKEGYKHSPLYSVHSNPINHRCSSDSAKTSLIDFQWPGG